MNERQRGTAWRVLQSTGHAIRALLLTIGLVSLVIGAGVLFWVQGQPKAENLRLLIIVVFVAWPALAIGVVLTGIVVIGCLATRATSWLPRPWGTREPKATEAEGSTKPDGSA